MTAITEHRLAKARRFVAAIAVEPVCRDEFVILRLGKALQRLQADPTCPLAHCLALDALAVWQVREEQVGYVDSLLPRAA